MKNRAFTLIELIFVLILVGILGSTAAALFRPDRLLNDTKFILAKIMKTRYEAIGYDHRNFDGSMTHAPIGCLRLQKGALEDNRSIAGSYRMKESTAITFGGIGGNTICFDSLGRPHDGDFSLASLLHRPVDINVSNGKKTYSIIVYPVSGYVTMKY
ncbi:pilus assembly FimT family protein [Hydrogenimonas urashimensis]|uniref:pilus assembly FimT family protein n=1 Tax=Hydrogenimonas urashimensis TaxID=2740515 RepID=UPI001916A89A|nr:prepilin-type N-terminal cleavage/methylation domain-containing protein [Hydrogenimonas urashimensis]